MFTNDQQNDDPSLNRGSANMINSNPAAGLPDAASQPGAPSAAVPLNAMSTPIQPYGAVHQLIGQLLCDFHHMTE